MTNQSGDRWEIDLKNGRLTARVVGDGQLWSVDITRSTPDQVMRAIRFKIKHHGKPIAVITDASTVFGLRFTRWLKSIGVIHEVPL